MSEWVSGAGRSAALFLLYFSCLLWVSYIRSFARTYSYAPTNQRTNKFTGYATTHPSTPPHPAGGFTLSRIRETVRLLERLEARTEATAAEFAAAMDLRAAAYGAAPHAPGGSPEHVASGSFYLEGINDKYHRTYARKA